MMWTLYKKELRYRVGALLVLPVLAALVLYYVWFTVRAFRTNSVYSDYYGGMLDHELAGWITLICAGVGFAFGLWQVLRETLVGPWAFFRHRPASVWQLYQAKFLAALTFYVLVTGLPLAGLVAWMATPNRLPIPWSWSMALPALQDFVGGAVYVLAGMFCASRPARWFGSRLFPVGLAVVGTMLTWSTPIWVGFPVLGLTGAILLIAGSSALTRRGREQSQPAFPRLITTITLWPATIGLLMGAVGLVVTLGYPSPTPGTYNTYYVFNDELILATNQQGYIQYQQVVDDHGHMLKEYPTLSTIRIPPYYENDCGIAIRRFPRLGLGPSRRTSSYYFRPMIIRQLQGASPDHWYYVPAWGCYVGYHYEPTTHTTSPLGYIGVDGWNQERGGITPFQPTNQYTDASMMIVEAHRILQVNFHTRTVEVLYAGPADETCISFALRRHLLKNGEAISAGRVVATDRGLLLLDISGKVVLRQPHPEGKYVSCRINSNPTDSQYGFLYQGMEWRDRQTQPLFVRVAADGKELSRTPVPLLPLRGSHAPAWASQAYATITPSWFLVLAWCFDPRKPTIPEMLVCVLGTGMGIGITLWLLRRYQVGRKGMALWVGVNLLLGLSAVLLMLAVRHWPVRVACPHCGKRRAVNQPLCPACGKDFPAPNPGEVGVFDRAVAG